MRRTKMRLKTILLAAFVVIAVQGKLMKALILL